MNSNFNEYMVSVAQAFSPFTTSTRAESSAFKAPREDPGIILLNNIDKWNSLPYSSFESALSKRLHIPHEMSHKYRIHRSYVPYLPVANFYCTLENVKTIEAVNRRVLQDAQDYSRRMSELCSMFRIVLTTEEIQLETEKYFFLLLIERAIPELKLSINLVFSRYYAVEEPPFDPDHNYGLKLFPRRLRRKIDNWIVKQRRIIEDGAFVINQKRDFLINTLFQGFKRGLLPASPYIIDHSLLENKELLGDDQTNELDLDESNKVRLHEILKDLLKGLKPLPDHRSANTIIKNGYRKVTTSATVEFNRSKFGTIGHALSKDKAFSKERFYNKRVISAEGHNIRTAADYANVDNTPMTFADIASALATKEFYGYTYPKYEVGRTSHTCYWHPIPVYQKNVYSIHDLWDQDNVVWDKSDENTPTYRFCDHLSRLGYEVKEPEAVRACVLEPLKVRIITKPSAGMHSQLHWIQDLLWNYLRTFDQFKLIGQEFDPQQDLLKFLMPNLGKWNSGDYSKATDKLRQEMTKIVLEAVIETIFPRYWEFLNYNYEQVVRLPAGTVEVMKSLITLENSLCNMRIFDNIEREGLPTYEKGDIYMKYKWCHTTDHGSTESSFDQKNGQLMGNVVSFVILCMANYAIRHLSFELTHRTTLTVSELERISPTLINGDDILFRLVRQYDGRDFLRGIQRKISYLPSEDVQYQIWTENCWAVGLEPSLGKNFLSDDFCMINSRLVRIKRDLKDLPTRAQLAQVRKFGRTDILGMDPILNEYGLKKKERFPFATDYSIVSSWRLVEVNFINFGYLTNRRKNDCTKDLSYTGMRRVQCDDVHGTPDGPSSLTRLYNLRGMYEECETPFQDVSNTARDILHKHAKPILLAYGLNFIKLDREEDFLSLRKLVKITRCLDESQACITDSLTGKIYSSMNTIELNSKLHKRLKKLRDTGRFLMDKERVIANELNSLALLWGDGDTISSTIEVQEEELLGNEKVLRNFERIRLCGASRLEVLVPKKHHRRNGNPNEGREKTPLPDFN